MKMVLIYFYEDKTDEVMELLKTECIENYLMWDKVKGQPAGFRPRMGSAVWPGHNGAVMFPVGDEQSVSILDRVNRFNEDAEYEGIAAYVFEISQMAVKTPKK